MPVSDQLLWWGIPLGLVALFWLATLEAHRRMWRSLTRMTALPAHQAAPWPRLSVIVPSCNEEKAVEAATRSLVAQDYPNLEIVAVDDRSTDRTGAILDGLAPSHPNLTVVHITSLPPGWLGKNHANHVGVSKASGEWILFTDGDVMFAPDALRRAIVYATHNQLDHLAALPSLVAPGFMERSAQTAAFALISTRFRTWELAQPRTKGYVGVGAFNLVRKAAYDDVGGHTPLAMEVADDMKLAMILRRSGKRCAMVDSASRVSVRWQEGFLNSFRGIIKNSFSGADWEWPLVLAGLVGLPLLTVFPWVAAVMAPSWGLRALALWSVAAAVASHGYGARRSAQGSGLEGLTNPLMSMMLLGTILLSATLATVRGGITWRGTFYPLKELRARCVRERDWPTHKVVAVVPTMPPSVQPGAADVRTGALPS